jgi:hypothetical protein
VIAAVSVTTARTQRQNLALVERLKAAASTDDARVRNSIAYRLLFHKETPLAYEIVGAMLQDPDKQVRRSAGTGLHNAVFGSSSPACKPPAEALEAAHGRRVERCGAPSLRGLASEGARLLGAPNRKGGGHHERGRDRVVGLAITV